MQYAWFIWSLILLFIWLLVFIFNKRLRQQMLRVSFWTMPLGLTEPLFVPEYWSPPSLFNLAQSTGFDIESLIFAFAIGGIAAVMYDLVFKTNHLPVSDRERHHRRHRFHLLALSSPALIFAALLLLTGWNHIYCAIAAMFFGSLATLLCRPDLKTKIWVGGLLFLGLYFIFFMTLTVSFPDYVRSVWNLSALSGILVFNVPLEELLFAFSLGMLWSSLYEHLYWYKIKG